MKCVHVTKISIRGNWKLKPSLVRNFWNLGGVSIRRGVSITKISLTLFLHLTFLYIYLYAPHFFLRRAIFQKKNRIETPFSSNFLKHRGVESEGGSIFDYHGLVTKCHNCCIWTLFVQYFKNMCHMNILIILAWLAFMTLWMNCWRENEFRHESVIQIICSCNVIQTYFYRFCEKIEIFKISSFWYCIYILSLILVQFQKYGYIWLSTES